MVFFKFIFSFFVLLIVGFYFFYLKRNKNYSRVILLKRCGVVCSKCSSDLIHDQNELIEALEKNNNLSECLSCRRESRLNLLVSFWYLKDKFDKWILKKKSERILILCILIPFPFIIASIFIGNKTFSNITSIGNSCGLMVYWLLMIYRVYLCRKPLSTTPLKDL
jgi:hypothetical protein